MELLHKTLPPHVPKEGEKYMNSKQRSHFKKMLNFCLLWRPTPKLSRRPAVAKRRRDGRLERLVGHRSAHQREPKS